MMAPGATVPGQGITNQGYSSYYVQGAGRPQTPVTPMAGIPYYNTFSGAGAAYPGMGTSGYAAYPARSYGYSSMYVAPGTTYGAAPTYMPARRGLFGGLFGRRNRQVYTAGPYGTTYGTMPYGTTTYGAAPYTYGSGMTTGSYTYGAAPY
jgi:hypothetical protein